MNCTNVVKDRKNEFNACDDFFVLIVSCHVIAATLKMLKMEEVNDTPSQDVIPNAENVWMQPSDQRKGVLDEICHQLVDWFVDFSFSQPSSSNTTDKIEEYGKQLLSIGLFYLEFCDAIREGDGNRVLRCWRYLLPIFLGSHQTNYLGEVMNMLFQQSYALPPRLSAELLWSRFINVHGQPGKNIPADLHMEHLNRLVKEAIKHLGANKTERAIMRIGKAVGTLAPVLALFDQELEIGSVSDTHHVASFEKERNILVHELVKSNVFCNVPGRKHSAFPYPRHVFHATKRNDVLKWTERLSKQIH